MCEATQAMVARYAKAGVNRPLAHNFGLGHARTARSLSLACVVVARRFFLLTTTAARRPAWPCAPSYPTICHYLFRLPFFRSSS